MSCLDSVCPAGEETERDTKWTRPHMRTRVFHHRKQWLADGFSRVHFQTPHDEKNQRRRPVKLRHALFIAVAAVAVPTSNMVSRQSVKDHVQAQYFVTAQIRTYSANFGASGCESSRLSFSPFELKASCRSKSWGGRDLSSAGTESSDFYKTEGRAQTVYSGSMVVLNLFVSNFIHNILVLVDHWKRMVVHNLADRFHGKNDFL